MNSTDISNKAKELLREAYLSEDGTFSVPILHNGRLDELHDRSIKSMGEIFQFRGSGRKGYIYMFTTFAYSNWNLIERNIPQRDVAINKLIP